MKIFAIGDRRSAKCDMRSLICYPSSRSVGLPAAGMTGRLQLADIFYYSEVFSIFTSN